MATWLNALTTPSVTNEPPSAKDLSRIDIAVIVTLIFALFLGFGIRNNARTASRTIELGAGLPSIDIPSNWITGAAEGVLLHARNPRSSSSFNTELVVTTRALPAGEDARGARTAVGMKRTQELLRYRELGVDRVTVDGQEGLLVTYAYVADPSRDQGGNAPPVVVQAQDLIFPSGNGQAAIITIASDASTWDKQQAAIDLIYDSLKVKILATDLRGESEEGGE